MACTWEIESHHQCHLRSRVHVCGLSSTRVRGGRLLVVARVPHDLAWCCFVVALLLLCCCFARVRGRRSAGETRVPDDLGLFEFFVVTQTMCN